MIILLNSHEQMKNKRSFSKERDSVQKVERRIHIGCGGNVDRPTWRPWVTLIGNLSHLPWHACSISPILFIYNNIINFGDSQANDEHTLQAVVSGDIHWFRGTQCQTSVFHVYFIISLSVDLLILLQLPL